jgi:1-acyl-sn-glycerol-3-phosphate acyltransferase
MRRLPLADQLPYRFRPPRLSPFWVWATRPFRRRMLRNDHRVMEMEVSGSEHLSSLLGKGDGILIAPNHCDHADALVLLDLSDQIGKAFCYMAAYQIFEGTAGLRHWLFPRIGAFPVDREGSDRQALKTGIEILSAGQHPLVVFPEGEIYYMGDRLTPLREGAPYLTVKAAEKLKDAGRRMWIVPTAMKYRFLPGVDPSRELSDLMSELEAHYTWWPHDDCSMVTRVYHYAEGTLALMELEYLGGSRTGSFKERLAALREHILDAMEDRLIGKRRTDAVPVRVKELRRCCLDRLAQPDVSPASATQLRRDLHDLFRVVQLFSYPGDYVRENPTLERVAEILTKLEEDASGGHHDSRPRGDRRVIVKLGAPIDVTERLASGAKSRTLLPALTTELETRMQQLLDEIGPGRPLTEVVIGSAAR